MHKEPIIVLNTNAIGEADLCVHYLGKQNGRASALAPNAKRSKKRFMGGIEAFDYGRAAVSPSRRPGALPILENLSEKGSFLGLRASTSGFALGSCCLELVLHFCAEGDPETSMFFAPLFLTLKGIAETEETSRQYVFASYFSLITFEMSGYHILEDRHSLSDEVASWFREMEKEEKPTIPEQSEVVSLGFNNLRSYAESIIGARLKSGVILPNL